MDEQLKIAIIGGTGDLGSGLAKRWAAAGHSVIVGSRSKEKAQSLATALSSELGLRLTGNDNAAAAAASDIVVIAVPYGSHASTLEEISGVVAGKIVVDAVVPLVPPKVATVQLPRDGSAAQEAARILGPSTTLVSAFHNVGASKLHTGQRIDCDVLVFGDDKVSKEIVVRLAEAIGSRGIDAGPLANSAAAEAMTSVLIGINRRYKVNGAGVSITGIAKTA
jgi:NADPH-dependent F420 reductase